MSQVMKNENGCSGENENDDDDVDSLLLSMAEKVFFVHFYYQFSICWSKCKKKNFCKSKMKNNTQRVCLDIINNDDDDDILLVCEWTMMK